MYRIEMLEQVCDVCSVVIHMNTLKHSQITLCICFISSKPGERGTDDMNSKEILNQCKQIFSCSHHEQTQKDKHQMIKLHQVKKKPRIHTGFV